MTKSKKLILTLLVCVVGLIALINRNPTEQIDEYVISSLQGEGNGFFLLRDDSFQRVKINQTVFQDDKFVVTEMKTTLVYRDKRGNSRKVCPQNSPHMVREFPRKTLMQKIKNTFSTHAPEEQKPEFATTRSASGEVFFDSLNNKFVVGYTNAINWYGGRPPFKVSLDRLIQAESGQVSRQVNWEKAQMQERTIILGDLLQKVGKYVLTVNAIPEEDSVDRVEVTTIVETGVTILPELPYEEFALPTQLDSEPELEKFLLCRKLSDTSSWKEFASSYCSTNRQWILESTYDESNPADNLCP